MRAAGAIRRSGSLLPTPQHDVPPRAIACALELGALRCHQRRLPDQRASVRYNELTLPACAQALRCTPANGLTRLGPSMASICCAGPQFWPAQPEWRGASTSFIGIGHRSSEDELGAASRAVPVYPQTSPLLLVSFWISS